MSSQVVLILGGGGVFGRRIAASLRRYRELEVAVAGRSGPVAIDVARADAFDRIREVGPALVVDAAGPFQPRDLGLAGQCAAHGIHYVDIADARARVATVVELDAIARGNGVAVISGASTVPAFTTAIVDEIAPWPDSVLEIDVGISPGHRAPRGLATVTAILGYCGKPIPPVCGTSSEYGWGSLVRHQYPAPVGARWLSNVDTPERALWAARYPSLQRASVRAGFEIGFLHLALAALSRGARARLLPRLDRFARPFLRVAQACDRFGTDTGAMHVAVRSRSDDGRVTIRVATLLAERGDGPQVPAAPAVAMVRRILGRHDGGPAAIRGAQPCMGLLTPADIMRELREFAIRLDFDA